MKSFEVPNFQTVIKDLSPRKIPDGVLAVGENILFDNMYVRERFGIEAFAESFSDPIKKIVLFNRLYADEIFVVFTTRNIFSYDKDSGVFKTITRCYNSGTATSSGATVTLTDGPTMDYERLTGVNYLVSFDSDDPDECTTWLDVESIDSASQFTLSEALTPAVTDSDYCLKLCYDGDEDDMWHVCFPYGGGSGSYGDEKVLLATNGIDFMQIWTGSGFCEDIPASINPNIYSHIGYWGTSSGGHIICSSPYDGVTASENYNAIEISDVNNIAWTAGATEALYDINSPVVGVLALGSQYLAIYKKNSISLGQVNNSGDASNPITINENVRRNIGAPSIDVVMVVDNIHIFYTGEKICSFDGYNIVDLSDGNTNYIFKNINKEYSNRCFSCVLPEKNLYMLFAPFGDSENCDTCIVLNYKTKAISYWTFGELSFSTFGFFLNSFDPIWSDYTTVYAEDFQYRWGDLGISDGIYRICLGTSDGAIYELGSRLDDDDGSSIVSTVRTKYYELNKGLTFLFLSCRVRAGIRQRYDDTFEDCTFRIRATTDYGLTWSSWVDLEIDADLEPEEYQEQKASFHMRGKAVAVEIEFTGNINFESIIIDFNDGGSSSKWDR